jgi:hypothetical protein
LDYAARLGGYLLLAGRSSLATGAGVLLPLAAGMLA